MRAQTRTGSYASWFGGGFRLPVQAERGELPPRFRQFPKLNRIVEGRDAKRVSVGAERHLRGIFGSGSIERRDLSTGSGFHQFQQIYLRVETERAAIGRESATHNQLTR